MSYKILCIKLKTHILMLLIELIIRLKILILKLAVHSPLYISENTVWQVLLVAFKFDELRSKKWHLTNLWFG